MKVKRITIEVEVPMRTMPAEELLALVKQYLDDKGIPHQAQVKYETSPNTQIGKKKEFTSYPHVEYKRNRIYPQLTGDVRKPPMRRGI